VEPDQIFTAPFAGYMQAVQSAVEDRERQARIAEAYGRHMDAMRQAADAEPGRRASEAFAAYEAAVRDGLSADGASGRAETAFRSYVDAVKDAFSRVDGAAIDPQGLATIAYQLGAVAWMAGGGASRTDGG
jgi:hypothetical protein